MFKSAPSWQELTTKFDNLIIVKNFILYETLVTENEILHKLKAQLTVLSFLILGMMSRIYPKPDFHSIFHDDHDGV